VRQIPEHVPETEGKAALTTLPGSYILWQHGPIGDEFNGTTVEGAIRASIARLEELNRAIFCAENVQAISFLNQALGELDRRTQDRYTRGVMGTRQP